MCRRGCDRNGVHYPLPQPELVALQNMYANSARSNRSVESMLKSESEDCVGGFVVGMWTSLELRLLIPGEPSHSESRKKLKSMEGKGLRRR